MFSELYHSALVEMLMWDFFFVFEFLYILYLDDSVHQKNLRGIIISDLNIN